MNIFMNIAIMNILQKINLQLQGNVKWTISNITLKRPAGRKGQGGYDKHKLFSQRAKDTVCDVFFVQV